MLYTAESTQFTPRFRQERLVYLRTFTETTKFDSTFSRKHSKQSKKLSYEDNAKISLHFFGDNPWLCYKLSAKTGTDRKF
jgi:hypothetical protein